MGLLDDAIREHLELKRKHGADPTEVARQEREALGSGRVPPPVTASDDAPAGAAALNAEAAEHGEAPPAHEPPFTDAIPEPPVDDVPAPAGGAVSMSRAPAPDPEPEIDWSDPAPADRGHDPEPAPPASAEEDVLEETPEFLQETPEHERLWFEQRPPKDFDF
jgi:hypothetical protein